MKLHILRDKLNQLVMEGMGNHDVVLQEYNMGFQHDIDAVKIKDDYFDGKKVISILYREG